MYIPFQLLLKLFQIQILFFFYKTVDHRGKMRIKLYGMSTEKLEAGKPKKSAKRKHWDFN